jgi:catechol 2,3-dioxygenase-like lactoylglutathione lyase family enzyme
MKIEHFAWMMPDPVAAADWYCKNLGLRVVRKSDGYPWGYFLLDTSGSVMAEIYKRKEAPVPDYNTIDPLVLHLALLTDDVKGTIQKLVAAGAKVHADYSVTPDGDEIAMLRDPWGFAIQLVKRGIQML